MAGRTLSKAVQNYIGPMTEALLCITQQRLSRPSSKGLALETDYSAMLANMDPVILNGDPSLKFSAGQTFRIVDAPQDKNPFGRYKISTLSYFYEIATMEQSQILSFHWQPDAKPSKPGEKVVLFPHLHVGAAISAEQKAIRPDQFHKVHIPTQRVSLEQVVWLLIDEFGVTPLKPDWRKTIARTEANFKQWKTW